MSQGEDPQNNNVVRTEFVRRKLKGLDNLLG